MSTSAPAPAAPTRPNLRLVSSTLAAPDRELVTVLVDGEPYGNVILPAAAAAELMARVDGEPSRLPELTPAMLAHVQWCLDKDFIRMAEHQPPPWICDLIWLIRHASVEDRARLGTIHAYAGYVCAVAILTGPDGLAELRALHGLVTRAAG